MGHSFGTVVASLAAGRVPGAISSLTLIEPSCYRAVELVGARPAVGGPPHYPRGVDILVPALATLALYAVVLGGLAGLAARVRRRGGGGSLMQPFDEIWHPIAHDARREVEMQQECPAPRPLPGDRLV